jgi:hypothetical protein
MEKRHRIKPVPDTPTPQNDRVLPAYSGPLPLEHCLRLGWFSRAAKGYDVEELPESWILLKSLWLKPTKRSQDTQPKVTLAFAGADEKVGVLGDRARGSPVLIVRLRPRCRFRISMPGQGLNRRWDVYVRHPWYGKLLQKGSGKYLVSTCDYDIGPRARGLPDWTQLVWSKSRVGQGLYRLVRDGRNAGRGQPDGKMLPQHPCQLPAADRRTSHAWPDCFVGQY